MKIIAVDKDNRGDCQKLIAELSSYEWNVLQRSAGIPHDKRVSSSGVLLDLSPIERNTEALQEIKSFRGELGKVMKRYDTLAERIDAALEK
jgi:hypothetical protein